MIETLGQWPLRRPVNLAWRMNVVRRLRCVTNPVNTDEGTRDEMHRAMLSKMGFAQKRRLSGTGRTCWETWTRLRYSNSNAAGCPALIACASPEPPAGDTSAIVSMPIGFQPPSVSYVAQSDRKASSRVPLFAFCTQANGNGSSCYGKKSLLPLQNSTLAQAVASAVE